MNQGKKRMVTESKVILSTKSQKQQIIQYIKVFGNNILVYSTFFNFNDQTFKYDSNGTAYSINFTNDYAYIILGIKNPHCFQIINLKTGEIFVIKGMDQFMQLKILAFSMQPQDKLKAERKNTKKLYLIYLYKDQIYLKVIQFNISIDNNPKTRTKKIQQRYLNGQNTLKIKPIFVSYLWNAFLICKREIRVCQIVKRNDELQFNFKIQAFQPKLKSLFNSFTILAISESSQTWSLVCASQNNKKQSQQPTINIFWQHHQNTKQISSNMYYLDKSFIKSLNIPCTQSQFKNLWQQDGFYFIQSQNNVSRTHKCHILSETANSNIIFTILLSFNSQICSYSLNLTENQIYMYEIVNNTQLYELKLLQSQTQQNQNISLQNQKASNESGFDRNKTTQIDRASTNVSSNPTNTGLKNNINSVLNENKNQKLSKNNISEQINQNIKKFVVVQQTKPNHIVVAQNGKNTVKKQQNKKQFNQQRLQQTSTTNFINPKLTQFLIQKQKQRNINKDQQSDPQVPQTYERLVSFGMAGVGEKKQLKKQVDMKKNKQGQYLSFGAQNPRAQNQTKESNMNQNIKDINISFGSSAANKPIQKAIKMPSSGSPIMMSFGTNSANEENISSKKNSKAEKQIPSQVDIKIDISNFNEIKQKAIKLRDRVLSQLLQRQNSIKRNYQQIIKKKTLCEQLKLQPIVAIQEDLKLKQCKTNIQKIKIQISKIGCMTEQQFNNKIITQSQRMTDLVNYCEQLLYYNVFQLPSRNYTKQKTKKNIVNIEQKIQKSIRECKSKLQSIQTSLHKFCQLNNINEKSFGQKYKIQQNEQLSINKGNQAQKNTKITMSLFKEINKRQREDLFYKEVFNNHLKPCFFNRSQQLLSFESLQQQQQGNTNILNEQQRELNLQQKNNNVFFMNRIKEIIQMKSLYQNQQFQQDH